MYKWQIHCKSVLYLGSEGTMAGQIQMTCTNVSYLWPKGTVAGPVPHFTQAEAAALHTLSKVLCAPSGQCTIGEGSGYSAGQFVEVECIALL